MSKVFECFWGNGYRDDEGKSILAYHGEEFFNEDRGYDNEEINSIKNLEIGEDYVFYSPFGEHWVCRIK